MLCPVLARFPFGLAVVMQRAQPLSEDKAERLRNTRGFPDWDYVPPDDECPFEFKASDWGDCQMADSLRWTIQRQRLNDWLRAAPGVAADARSERAAGQKGGTLAGYCYP